MSSTGIPSHATPEIPDAMPCVCGDERDEHTFDGECRGERVYDDRYAGPGQTAFCDCQKYEAVEAPEDDGGAEYDTLEEYQLDRSDA